MSLEPNHKPWAERKYRGKTSLNIAEALGWSNKKVLEVTVVGALALVVATIIIHSKRT